MAFVKALLLRLVGPIVSLAVKVWTYYRAKKQAKQEARLEQLKRDREQMVESQKLAGKVNRADDNDLDQWLRPPSERE